MKKLKSGRFITTTILLLILLSYLFSAPIPGEITDTMVLAASTVAQPVLSPETGTYLTPQTVTVTCATPGATIRYTKDGTTPTTTSPAIASGGTISVSKTVTIKARAWKTGYTTSSVASARYDIDIVATPTLSVASGTYTAVQKVVVSCATPDAVIHYTTNGADPTESDPMIESEATVTIDKTTTLKAKAFRQEWTPSAIKSASYTIRIVDAPVFTPDTGSYLTAQRVVVSCLTPGATIRYTKDGTTPTTTSPTIASGGVINVTKTGILKARAWRTGYGTSPVKSGNYEIRIVTTPTLSVAGGTYTAVQKVIAACATPGAVMHYTTNGLDPTENDLTIESGAAILIDKTLTLKVKAFKDDWTSSGVKSAVYKINVVEMPVFEPDSGSYPTAQTVRITCSTMGATIHYTKDGTTPTVTSPTIVSGGTIKIAKTMVLKAKAWKTGYGTSLTKSANYEIRIVATPTLSVASGIYTAFQKVVVNCVTPGAAIHYTTNGVDPMENDSIVESGTAITVDQSMTLRVKAFKENWTPSGVRSATYTINAVKAPVFSPDAGSYLTVQPVTVTCPTPGATVRYTTDGTTPTTTSPTIVSGRTINVAKNMTIKAKAWKTGFTTSATASASYEIRIVATPTLSLTGGTYMEAKTVVVNCTTPGAIIHYTKNGADPTESDPVVESGSTLMIDKTMTLKVRAFKQDWTPSDVRLETYEICVTEMPVFSVDSGVYYAFQQVTVTCPTPGATIHYTTDGTTPTSASKTIASDGTIDINKTMTLKAKAYKNGYVDSPVATADYEIRAVQTPRITPSGGTYTNILSVYITDETPGAVIHYTTNGDDPTETDAVIAAGHSLDVVKTTTLKARAFKEGWTPSEVKTAEYTLNYAEKPVFGPDEGTYSEPQQVTVTCATPGAEIHYTTDGLLPDQSDPVIESGKTINVYRSMDICAVTYKDGFLPSPLKWAHYEITIVVNPTMSIESGTYTAVQNVVLTCLSMNAKIHYTTNGAEPTKDDPYVYSGQTLTVNQSMILKAKAFWLDWTPSETVTAEYTINIVDPPVLSLKAGSYATSQQVAVTCPTPDAAIHYTTDGTEPTEISPAVASGGTVTLTKSSTLKAKAFKEGYGPSATVSADYEIRIVEQPTFSIPGGIYLSIQNVGISCNTQGTVIHYTTNGIDPTVNDPVIASGETVAVDRTMILKARGFRESWAASDVETASYTINMAATPAISPNGGVFTAPQTAAITCSTAGVTIHYTTDGSEPTESSQVYTNPIAVNETMAIKAKTWATGNGPSLTASAGFEIRIVQQPVLSLSSRSSSSALNVAVTCDTPNAIIHYTLNGTEPTENDPAVASGESVRVAYTSTLKVKAFLNGWGASKVATAAYTITSVMTPTLDPPDGCVKLGSYVRFHCETPGATMRYTTNGITPTTSSTVIAEGGKIAITKNTIIKVQAWKNGLATSGVRTVNCVIALSFGSSGLEEAIAEALGKPNQLIVPADVPNLKVLHAEDREIDSLDGIERFTDLRELYLSENQIADLAPLASLSALTTLDLSDNRIVNLQPLANLKNLTTLQLNENHIRDIQALSGLTNLKHLELNQSLVLDFTPLQPLTQLEYLSLNTNYIDDQNLTPILSLTNLNHLELGRNYIHHAAAFAPLVNLEYLDLSSNEIRDPSGLSSMASLKHLSLADNRIHKIDGLSGLTNLQYLDLSDNDISNLNILTGFTNLLYLDLEFNRISDITSLAGLTNLLTLNINDNHVANISALSGLTNLETLEIGVNPITSISVLSGLTHLKTLYMNDNDEVTNFNVLNQITTLRNLTIANCDLTNLSMITNLKNLESLNLDINQITTVQELNGMNQLKTLYLYSNKIVDGSPIGQLTGLIELDIGSNPIGNFSFLANLVNLKHLDLSSCKLTDVSVLSPLTNLETLSVAYNELTNIQGLSTLTNLETLWLTNNKISDLQPISGLVKLRNLSVAENLVVNIDALSALYQLHELLILDNQITDIKPIAGLKDLRYLSLAKNPFTDLSPIVGLYCLRDLDLQDLLKVQDYEALREVTTLHQIYANGANIADLSPLSNLINLEELHLDGNAINDFTPLTLLNRFSVLNIADIPIQDYSAFSNMKFLHSLTLDRTGMTSTTFVTGLSNLHYLELNENQIVNLSGISALSHLRDLYLNKNQLSNLAPLSGLNNLEVLYLEYNSYTDINVLLSLPSLFYVDLSFNEYLDDRYGYPADQVIRALQARDCTVYHY